MSSILRGNDNPPDIEQHSAWQVALVLPLTGLVMWGVMALDNWLCAKGWLC